MKVMPVGLGKFNRAVEARGSSSSGKLLRKNAKKSKPGRVSTRREKRGPKYCGSIQKKSQRLYKLSKENRISYRDLAGLSCIDRVRVGVELKYLPKREGALCPYKCGTRLELSDRDSFQRSQRTLRIGNVSIKTKKACRYVCKDWTCKGMPFLMVQLVLHWVVEAETQLERVFFLRGLQRELGQLIIRACRTAR